MTWGEEAHGQCWAGSAPTVDRFPVAPGRTLGARDAITFGVHAVAETGKGTTGGDVALAIVVAYPDGRREVARAAGAWRPLFATSTITASEDRLTVAVRRAGVWPGAPTLEVSATSAGGNALALGYGEEYGA